MVKRMTRQHWQGRISLVQGDITKLPQIDVVVAAANELLAGGGGVDGAIHHAAGPELVVASRKLAPCPAGQARITPGFELPAKFVIHAVGPIYSGSAGDGPTLASAYRSALSLAAESDAKSIAFPCISTGVYGYPQDEAANIAVDTVISWLSENESPQHVTFCCFLDADFQIYRARLSDPGE